MQYANTIVATLCIAFALNSVAVAQTVPSPLVEDIDVGGMASMQARIQTKVAKAQEAELDARIAKANRELENAKATAPAGGSSGTAGRTGSTIEPVVNRVYRVGVDGPLVALVTCGTAQVTVSEGQSLPGGWRVVSVAADGVAVRGNGETETRSLGVGQTGHR